ncbi:flagellar motor switch protein FliM [Amaricoccus macauensis]|uniref:Flagellar motor switch protein FliM n=1 Tax=Amaricoccus macauensis TaxID=57001 RepID=A0A840SSU4_9RHOB|nr:FliM/FliN family flagellar motor switch protein [Amaricoccus macauensis]MBB5222271.1 flagellar motor switch protein FliM [Amaricoccus macauensis]
MASGGVLAQKLKQRGIARSPLPDSEFVGQAFARQIERAFRPLLKAPVGAVLIDGRTVKVAEALQGVPVPAMLCLVGMEGTKGQGLLMLDSDLAYHLVDLMLGGDASVAPMPLARTFTAIDMALCGLAQTAALAAIGDALAAAFGRPLQAGFQIAGQMQDVGQVRLAAPHVDLLVYSVALDIGSAARSGVLNLMLPLGMLDVVCAAMQTKADALPPDEATDLWRVQMGRAAILAPVVLDAVLHTQRMSVNAALALKVGDVIEVPPGAVSEVRLLLDQRGGKCAQLATGRLGAYRGAKVVKLDGALDPRVGEHVRRALRRS